jgi:hypothetical protein
MLGKRGNLGSLNGITRTAHADGEGGIIIHAETYKNLIIDWRKDY